ncbi:MAG: HAD hydrolase-like protein, partial [Pseudolabrys sp.]|nr:HAD hydrolase-like protein [Pseudolabrys sp.]
MTNSPSTETATSKLVLFDVDGTLVDSQHMICAAMHQAYDDHALPRPTHERVRSIIGLSLSDAFTHLAEGADHPVAGLVERYKAAFFALREKPDSMESLYPGARDAVMQLARRVTLGVATGKSTRGVEAVLGHYGLLDLFTV